MDLSSIVLLVAYIVFSAGGAALIKYGGLAGVAALFTIPVVNVSVSTTSLIGIFGYGIGFILYIVLLSKLDMSFLVPVSTAVIYILLMIVSVLVFNESFTLLKTLGCILILAGVILIVMSR